MPDQHHDSDEIDRRSTPSTLAIVGITTAIVLGYLATTAIGIDTGTDAIGLALQVIVVLAVARLVAIIFHRSW